ncbi:MAG: hypothetical protein M1830_010758 [Pleopsidium flavum]|nr:MAG: hypothetical protein M1830_010758 [Pleopsidium flavum]
MPPKKSKAMQSKTKEPSNDTKSTKAQLPNPEDNTAVTAENESVTKSTKNGASTTVGSKRKAKSTSTTSLNKAPRRSGRSAPQTPVDQTKMLQFLLSHTATDLCRPQDELEDLFKRGNKLKTYSSTGLTPFEELVCAVILSRPISHRLGLRTIRTIFNEPYNFTTPKAIREAGSENRHKALWDARTQHKDKTAEQLGGLADVVVERFADGEDDTSLEKARKDAGYDVEAATKERELLKTHIKGLGKTGLDIFFRRVQALWPNAYPFADQRTLSAFEKLGLPGSAKDLKELIEEKWSELKFDDVKGLDEEDQRRKVFVRVLERAVGADLEGKAELAKEEARKM